MIRYLKENRLTALSAFTIFFGLFCATVIVFGDVAQISDNIHDFWIPVNAGYSVMVGQAESGVFHSPFGGIYFLLSSNALRLTSAFPDILNVTAIHYLMAFQFLVVLTAVYLVGRAIQSGNLQIPLWFFAALLLLCFQARTIDGFYITAPHWFGNYNSQLWSLLLLQAASNYLWNERTWTERSAAVLAVFQGLFLFIALNYKISFAPAAGLLCMLPFFYLGSTRRILVYVSVGVVFMAATTGMVAGIGFSYSQYLSDLAAAAAAKSSAPEGLPAAGLSAVIYLAALQVVRHHKAARDALNGTGPSIRTYLVNGIFGRVKLRELAFDSVGALALFLSQLGDFQRSVTPYFLMIAFVGFGPILQNLSRPKGSLGLLHFGAAGWVAAFCYTSLATMYEVGKMSRPVPWSPPIWDQISVIDYAENPISFRFPHVSSIKEFLAGGLFVKSDDWGKTLIERSYSFYAEAEIDPVGLPDVFENQEYIEGINSVVSWFKSKDLIGSGIAVESIGFANPWPFLTKNRFARETSHWVHIGTTIAATEMDTYYRTLETADILVLELLGSDRAFTQFYFNCTFFLWNLNNGEPFVPQEVVGTHLIFAREGGKVKPWSNLGLKLSKTQVEKRCGQLSRFVGG